MATMDDGVELRGMCPREIVDVIDGWSQAKRITRTDAVNHILRMWARQKLHEHSVIAKVTKNNPMLSEPAPGALE